MSDLNGPAPGDGSGSTGIGAVLERLWADNTLRTEVGAGALLLPVMVAGHARMIDYLLYLLLALALFAGEAFRVSAAGLLGQIKPEGLAEAATLLRVAEFGVWVLRAALIVLVLSVLVF